MKYICALLSFFCCLLFSNVNAQSMRIPEGLTKKEKKLFLKAKSAEINGDLNKSIKFVNKILKKNGDPNVLAQKALFLEQMDKNQEALKIYQQINSKSPGHTASFYKIGMLHYELENYTQAQSILEKYLVQNTKAERSRANAQKALDNIHFILVEKKAYEGVVLESLGNAINSNDLEYLPSINAEENTIVFTRRVNGQEDLYISRKNDEGYWTMAHPMLTINSPHNEAAQCISADGKTMIVTKCDPGITHGSCDLFISYFDGVKWLPASNLGTKVNSRAWESQPSLSADGKYLIFSSDRKGGLGGRDLWITVKDDRNDWSNPVNLGSVINTEGDDETPFLHPDGTSLFFRSNGRPGYGGFDLYRTKLSKNGWGQALNLGSPINTSGDEGSIVINIDGDVAYFASERVKGQKGDIDIFKFSVPEPLRPDPVTFVKIKVIDRETQMEVAASIKLHAFNNNEAFYEKEYDPILGDILVILPLGDDYAILAENSEYLFYSRKFELSEINYKISPEEIIVELSRPDKVKKGRAIVLENVLFKTGSAELREVSYQELDALANMINENKLRVEILGHTDNVGDTVSNLKLSEDRAQAVFKYLLEKSVNNSTLSWKGFGESVPIASNETEEGRQLNRRVEFKILE